MYQCIRMYTSSFWKRVINVLSLSLSLPLPLPPSLPPSSPFSISLPLPPLSLFPLYLPLLPPSFSPLSPLSLSLSLSHSLSLSLIIIFTCVQMPFYRFTLLVSTHSNQDNGVLCASRQTGENDLPFCTATYCLFCPGHIQ